MSTGADWGRGAGADWERDWRGELSKKLFEQRVVLLQGILDEATATRVSAELMTLDAEGDAAVSLRIDCAQGSLALALTVMDVIELLGVPVRALCLGRVGGPAMGILSVCAWRAAMPSTRFSWREPPSQPIEAHARDIAQWAELRVDERRRFCARIAAAIGKQAHEVEAAMDAGRFMSAEEAKACGLLDEVCGPEASIHRLPGQIGFRPGR